MEIKQQEQIKAFLIDEFGQDKGNGLFGKQEKLLDSIIKNTTGKSDNQMKTLVQTILPRIALYKAMSETELSEDEICTHMRKYMLEIVAAEKHASTAKMEIVPGFFSIYRKVFLKIMRTTDLWESVQRSGKDYFEADITKCLWHTACVENGCAQLCKLFCDVDGGLKKMGFSRTKTLGYGGDCCDFHFYKK